MTKITYFGCPTKKKFSVITVTANVVGQIIGFFPLKLVIIYMLGEVMKNRGVTVLLKGSFLRRYRKDPLEDPHLFLEAAQIF
jgi:hypothetical protein